MVRVLIVDDHRVLRDGLHHLLEIDPEIRVAATASTAEEALGKAMSLFVEVALIDFALPDHDGLWLLRRIKERRPELPVVFLSMHSDQKTVLEAFDQGASGYLTKGADPDELRKAIKVAHQGGAYLQAELAPFLLKGAPHSVSGTRSELVLTCREAEVLERVGLGQSNQQIADGLFLSLSAVKSVLRGLFEKFGVASRTELALQVSRRGSISKTRD